MALTIQQKLPEQLSTAFNEVLPPELLNQLRDTFVPLRAEVLAGLRSQKGYHEAVLVKLSEHYTGLSSDIKVIREHLNSSRVVQQRIESCLSSSGSPKRPLLVHRSTTTRIQSDIEIDNINPNSNDYKRDLDGNQGNEQSRADASPDVWQQQDRERDGDHLPGEFPAREDEMKNECEDSLRDV